MQNTSPIRTFLLLCTFFVGFQGTSQSTSEKWPTFVRIYNLEGKKIMKGRVVSVTDTQITLSKGKTNTEQNISDIGFIRTKHAVGNNVLIGAIAGASVSAIAFAAEADPDAWIFGYTAAEGVLAGIILGAPLGGSIGALTSLFKKKNQYVIKGDQAKWMAIKDSLVR